MSLNPNQESGLVKTSVYCHDCSKNFVAIIDYDIDGNHEVICPYCGHTHCRTIKNGVVTSDRWDHKNDIVHHDQAEKVWTHNNLKMATTSTSAYLRNRWLNLEQS